MCGDHSVFHVMINHSYRSVLLVAMLAWLLSCEIVIAQIETVLVGNAGNGIVGSVGSVNYSYRMGTYEVTNDQYAEFLNAKAKSDPFKLFFPALSEFAAAGIVRTGADGHYEYTVKPNMGNKPAVSIDRRSALRFVNWLHNGKGDADTESGAYALITGRRNPDAKWFLPTRDEWFKAAYFDPTLNDGNGGFYRYATKSNELPTVATANEVGDVTNPGPNVVNYNNGALWNGEIGNVTTVGSTGSPSFYGTYDQSGNVYEIVHNGSGIAARGGSWGSEDPLRISAGYAIVDAVTGVVTSGLRVAQTAISMPGDFDANSILDDNDLNLLARELQVSNRVSFFNLNGDTAVDGGDFTAWVKAIRRSWIGDTNLDGVFDSQDLLEAFQAGLFEDSQEKNAKWRTGDWNGDSEFDNQDLIAAFQDGGYDAGPRPVAVPEPAGAMFLLVASCLRRFFARRS